MYGCPRQGAFQRKHEIQVMHHHNWEGEGLGSPTSQPQSNTGNEVVTEQALNKREPIEQAELSG